jgi:hypothetical protein
MYIPLAHANPTNNLSNFYFKDVLGINSDPIYDSNLGLTVLVSESFPTKLNDSVYPPNIFNGLNLNSEEWITWFSTTWLFYFLDDLTGGYEEFDEFNDIFEGLELLFPNPLRIVETYEYGGDETININGNINFNLYLRSKIFSKISANDKVKIGFYYLNPESLIPVPIKIDDKIIEINPDLFENIAKEEIILEDINHSLKPGESLLFEVELIPGNKTIIDILIDERPVLENLTDMAIEILYNLANNSDNPNLDDIIEIIDMVYEVIEEVNITKEDAAIVVNSIISTSLVYDSVNHPSFVSVPFNIPSDSDDDNEIIYFLHSDNIMNQASPNSDQHSTHDLSSPIQWDGPTLNRSKILNNANALIHINYKDINFLSNNIQINAEILYKNQQIASSNYILDKTQLKSPNSNIIINILFDNFNDNLEIEYSNALSLRISLDNQTDLGQGFLRNAEIYYDSSEYPSKLILYFSDTDNIKLSYTTDPLNMKITPGGNVIYFIEISSEYKDDIEIIELSYTGNKEYWDIKIPETFSIEAGLNKTIEIILTSTEIDLETYGEEINIKYSIQGKTGKGIINVVAIVSEDAVEYDINIIVPPNKEIKHGTSDSYYFIVKNNNTGLWPDSYNIKAISENDWNISIKPSNRINDLGAGETVEINVTIFIPANIEIKTDNLTFNVTSINAGISEIVILKSNIIGPNLLENIYNFFDSIAKDLGFDEIFDEYAPHALVALFILIIFIILIIITLINTTKYVKIICSERIKEILPNQSASFDISVKNITKKKRIYKFSTNVKRGSLKWLSKLDINETSLNPSETKKVILHVKSNDLIQKDDWGEFDFEVETIGKRKIEKISTMAIIINPKSNLSIKNLMHFPKFFREGERILTSFILRNEGNVSTETLDLMFYLNGEEKNKVVDLIIPAEGFAEIKIPWISVKGKNEITIVVKKY